MNTWALPAAAGAFWAGLVAWSAHPPWVRAWMGFAVGIAALVAAWLAAPAVRPGPSDLERLGLAAPESATLEAVAAPRLERRATGTAVGVFAMVGVFCLALGWAGVQDARLAGSFLASLGPERVTVAGTLRTDPSVGGFGWSAVVDVSSVEWDGGVAGVRESVWVSGE